MNSSGNVVERDPALLAGAAQNTAAHPSADAPSSGSGQDLSLASHPESVDIEQTAAALVAWFKPFSAAWVAFSGGVDSAVVATAAFLALRDKATAATGVSASLATVEREIAQRIAKQIGIRHLEIITTEQTQPEYLANSPRRCFYCKQELYRQIHAALTTQQQVAVVVNGTNADDLGDYRPGLEAATAAQVLSPLVELKLGKLAVRSLAKHWQLPVWDKPASPCLSSRVAYGEEITAEKLAMIEHAEAWFRLHGFLEFRVRLHPGGLARVELPLAELARLTEPSLRSACVAELKRLGFRFVTLDLTGFFSGSLNILR